MSKQNRNRYFSRASGRKLTLGVGVMSALSVVLALAWLLGPVSRAALARHDSPQATFTVDNISDNSSLSNCTVAPNDCSLRGAIGAAAALAGADIIEFDAAVFATPQTLTILSGELAISENLTINGPGAGMLIISGNNTSRIFRVAPGRVQVNLNNFDNDIETA